MFTHTATQVSGFKGLTLVAFGATGRERRAKQWEIVIFPNNERVKQIAAGRLFSFCVVDGRTVYTFGVNNYRMLGTVRDEFSIARPVLTDLSDVDGDVIKVYCGYYQTIMKTSKFVSIDLH
jgi:alpha-tubulin suppressor-like RCC1 family protein